MAHAQKPDFVFRRKRRFHLNRPVGVSSVDCWQRGVRISGSNAGYTMFRGSVKSTGYPLHLNRPVGASVQSTAGSRGVHISCSNARYTMFRGSVKSTGYPLHLNRPVGASVQSTTGSRGVHISCSNAGYTMFRGSVKGTGYPLHSPVSPSHPLPCVTVCHHISSGLYIGTALIFLQPRHYMGVGCQ